MVEGEGFRELMSYLEPGYTIPSRKYFSSTIQRKHVLGKQKIKLKMKVEAQSVALTTDIWTSVAVEAYDCYSSLHRPKLGSASICP